MPGGRPVEYDPAVLLPKCREYLDSCTDEPYKLVKTDGDKSITYEHRIKVNLPSVEGLALHLRTARSTLYEWEKTYPEFSDIMEELKAKQAKVLLEGGLSGDYNPTISKVILTKHGYREGIENMGEGGGPLKVDIGSSLKKIYGSDPGTSDDMPEDG